MSIITERAKRYHDDLAPHVKQREGAEHIRNLLAEIEKLERERSELNVLIPSEQGKVLNITHSIETLHHLSCPECKKWWSIADWQPTNFVYCPHCGKRGELTD